jgi:hypothetical protein
MPVKATYEKTEYYQYHPEAISTRKTSGCSTPTKDPINADRRYDIITAYRKAKEIVLRAGFREEILWQASVNFDDVTESCFLREHAWVTLSAGMRERVIRNLFQAISSSFYGFESAKIIVENESRCRCLALRYFNNIRKVDAIILTAHGISSKGFSTFKEALYSNPLELLQSLPYIGPVTCYHLAKNIGLQVAKPDRHLTRLANYAGYDDVQLFCKDISLQTGDSVPVVDIVLWRFASITEDYLDFFCNAVMNDGEIWKRCFST